MWISLCFLCLEQQFFMFQFYWYLFRYDTECSFRYSCTQYQTLMWIKSKSSPPPVQFSHESIHNFLIISSNNTNKQTNKNHLRVRGIKLQIYSQHFLPSLVVWQVTYSDLCSELSVFVCVAIQVSNVTDACVFIN